MSGLNLTARAALALLLIAGASRAQEAGPPTALSNRAGAVHWHVDLDAATRAAAESGRPVLLFQALGRLDEHVC